MSEQQDPYSVLGVERSASDGDIKKAYRKLAMKYHPDRNKGDKGAEKKFKEIQGAYSILSDNEKRAAFDRFGHAGVDPSMGGGAGGAGFNDIFEEIFDNMFGAGGGGMGGGRSSSGRRASRGADLRYHLELILEEAVHGVKKEIHVPKLASCSKCKGSGAKPGSKPVTCDTCEGHGQVRMQQGFFSIQQTCPACHGQGQVIKSPCSACRGQGRVQEDKKLSVKVPAGVDNGDRIRLSGEGEGGTHGAGDLYVQVEIQPHELFAREGNDLMCEVPISYITAALGGEVEVPTLTGRVKLKIPAETQSGKSFRLRGRGVRPVRGGATGDLLCQVVVETPVKLSNQQKDLLRQFDQTLVDGGDKHSPHSKGWFERVRDFFEGS